jgi:hypothetical protein
MPRSTERLPIVVKEPFGAVPELRPLRRDLYMAEIVVHMRPDTDSAAGVTVRDVMFAIHLAALLVQWAIHFYC